MEQGLTGADGAGLGRQRRRERRLEQAFSAPITDSEIQRRHAAVRPASPTLQLGCGIRIRIWASVEKEGRGVRPEAYIEFLIGALLFGRSRRPKPWRGSCCRYSDAGLQASSTQPRLGLCGTVLDCLCLAADAPCSPGFDAVGSRRRTCTSVDMEACDVQEEDMEKEKAAGSKRKPKKRKK